MIVDADEHDALMPLTLPLLQDGGCCHALPSSRRKSVAPAETAGYLGIVKARYKKLLAADTFAPTPTTREARKAALALNLPREERRRLAATGGSPTHEVWPPSR